MAAPVVAETAEIVCHVDHQRGPELAAKVLQCSDVGSIRIHREQTLGDHQNRVLAVMRADPRQVPARRIEVEMAVAMDVARRRGGALLQAGMGKRVDDDVVARADETLDHAEAGGPAGGIEHGVPQLCAPYSSIAALAASLMAGCELRLR